MCLGHVLSHALSSLLPRQAALVEDGAEKRGELEFWRRQKLLLVLALQLQALVCLRGLR